MSSNMAYRGNCISIGDGDAINDMKDNAREITYGTFMRYCDTRSVQEVARSLEYDYSSNHGGISLRSDPYVSYWRSRYKGLEVVYFAWSGIEHVFCARELTTEEVARWTPTSTWQTSTALTAHWISYTILLGSM